MDADMNAKKEQVYEDETRSLSVHWKIEYDFFFF